MTQRNSLPPSLRSLTSLFRLGQKIDVKLCESFWTLQRVDDLRLLEFNMAALLICRQEFGLAGGEGVFVRKVFFSDSEPF